MDLRAICLASPEFVDVNYVPGPPLFLLLRQTTVVFSGLHLFGLQCRGCTAIIF